VQAAPDLAIDPAALAAWKSFLRAHAVLIRALERELLAVRGLPLAEYDVLVQLAEVPEGRLRMAQLADRVLLSRSGLTRLVERMEASGLVRREVCPSDARGSFATLTEEGRRRLVSSAEVHMRSLREHFAGPLDSGQMGQLRAVCDRLLEGSPEEPIHCPSSDRPVAEEV
jgi:DNA-binding MarR family transcriptional regulator